LPVSCPTTDQHSINHCTIQQIALRSRIISVNVIAVSALPSKPATSCQYSMQIYEVERFLSGEK
jgi:hypothetical protein